MSVSVGLSLKGVDMKTRFLFVGVIAVWILALGGRAAAQDAGPYVEGAVLGRGSALAVAWSPSGESLAVGSTRGLWLYGPDPAYQGELVMPSNGAVDVAFSPDGSRIAMAGADGAVILWDVAKEKQVCVCEGHTGRVTAVAFSPDGTPFAGLLASAADDGTLRIWNAANGVEWAALQGHSGWVLALAWSADGSVVFSAGADGTLQRWDTATGDPLPGFDDHAGIVLDLALSPDGTRLAGVGPDGRAWLWDARTGDELIALAGTPGVVYEAVAWSPDGMRLAVGYRNYAGGGGLTFWDAGTLDSLGVALQGAWHGVRQAALSPDGKRLATAGWDHALGVWDAATGVSLVAQQGEYSGLISALAWSPDGAHLAALTADAVLGVWAPAGGTLQAAVPVRADAVAMGWSEAGELAVSRFGQANGYCGIMVWDSAAPPESVVPFRPLWSEQGACSAAPRPDLVQIAAARDDGTLALINVASGSVDLTWDAGQTALLQEALFWSPDGRKLATEEETGTVRVWDAVTGKLISQLDGALNPLEPRLAWNADGTRLAGITADGSVRVWDAAMGTALQTVERRWRALAWGPDGAALAMGGDEGVRILDPATGAVIATLPDPATALAWRPDGRALAVAVREQNVIRLWETP